MGADNIITTPPIPATTVALKNSNLVPVLIQLYDPNAGLSALTANGKPVGEPGTLVATTFVLDENAEVVLTYADAAGITWKWYALT
jgi:hypothetical protein